MDKKLFRAYDAIGNIVVVKFPRDEKISIKEKKKLAEKFLKEHKQFTTVVEKSEKIKGKLRKLSTKFLAGFKTSEVLYKENNCQFRFDINETYFSPRLSSERKELAEIILKDSKNKQKNILVLFAGVAPFSIVIGKVCKNASILSIELNKKASKYAEVNVKLNKLRNVEVVQGDVKRILPKLSIQKNFDYIVMARPQVKDKFLKEALSVSKKGTKIFYYDFIPVEEISTFSEEVKNECLKHKKIIKILKTKEAGEIGPYYKRVRVDFEVV